MLPTFRSCDAQHNIKATMKEISKVIFFAATVTSTILLRLLVNKMISCTQLDQQAKSKSHHSLVAVVPYHKDMVQDWSIGPMPP